jgi:hypothetical protein
MMPHPARCKRAASPAWRVCRDAPADFKELLNPPKQSTRDFVPSICGRPMEILVTFAIVYVAIGAALFAHPASPALPDDFHWRSQIAVFLVTLPEVLAWPIALWRFGRTCLGKE